MEKQDRIRTYVTALQGANAGIDELQARTMVYYAVATYYEEIDPFPILLIKNDFGCGKSDLIETLFPMCNCSEWIKGTTEATIRDELADCRTAFFDENEALPEKWLVKRFKKSNSQISVNRGLGKNGWQLESANLFGATVVAKRQGFRDGALNSRCLTIQPKYIEDCNCKVTDVGSLQDVVDEVRELPQVMKSGRTAQVWKPLEGVAKAFNDEEWLEWAKGEFGVDMEVINLMRMYEPREAVLMAIEICRNDTVVSLDEGHTRFKLSDLKNIINTEADDLKLTSQEIGTILIQNGYRDKIKKYHGYLSVDLS